MTTPKHAADPATPRLVEWLTPTVRRWLYGVALAVVPLLVAYGAIEDAQAPLWIALASSVLSTSTALLHTPQEGSQ